MISANRASRRRSASTTSRMPGRRTFSTTAVPSSSQARCACASDAAASGSGSSRAKMFSGASPRSSINCGRMASYGNAGTAFCNRLSSAIHSGGSRSMRVASTCPSLTKVGPSASSARRRRSGGSIRRVSSACCQCSRRPARSSAPARPTRRTMSPKPLRIRTDAISCSRPRSRTAPKVSHMSASPVPARLHRHSRSSPRSAEATVCRRTASRSPSNWNTSARA